MKGEDEEGNPVAGEEEEEAAEEGAQRIEAISNASTVKNSGT